MPQIGMRLHYEFKNGIQINYLMTYTYDMNMYSNVVQLYEDINGEERLLSTVFNSNNEFWNGFTLSIPVYDFGRKKSGGKVD